MTGDKRRIAADLPGDFIVYIFLIAGAITIALFVVGAAVVAIGRRVRRHNEQAAKAKAAVAAARGRGYVVLDEEDGMTDSEVTAMLDAVFGRNDPEILATRPFGEPKGYGDRDRWAS